MRVAFAGDRLIAVEALKHLLNKKVKPLVLLLPENNQASHGKDLRSLCSYLKASHILQGNAFKTRKGIHILKKLNLDYLISIHFPYIYPKEVLQIPAHGALNLHPAYLPFNQGWHTPSWAIIEKTPYGATFHFMEENLDMGDIVYQEKLKVNPDDTANSLYQRVLSLELKIFKKSLPDLKSFKYRRKKQSKKGTFHAKKDLSLIQEIKLEERLKAGDLIDRLKALTTNNIKEASYFKEKGEKYKITVNIVKNEA
jgi:methionyl-tRNA formyltransferase